MDWLCKTDPKTVIVLLHLIDQVPVLDNGERIEAMDLANTARRVKRVYDQGLERRQKSYTLVSV